MEVRNQFGLTKSEMDKLYNVGNTKEVSSDDKCEFRCCNNAREWEYRYCREHLDVLPRSMRAGAKRLDDSLISLRNLGDGNRWIFPKPRCA